MAWNWSIGYKFLLAEGEMQTADGTSPLVYHVGFDENRRDISYEVGINSLPTNSRLDFHVDIPSLFSGKNAINLAQLQTVKMDKSDAALLADNYADMITFIGITN